MHFYLVGLLLTIGAMAEEFSEKGRSKGCTGNIRAGRKIDRIDFSRLDYVALHRKKKVREIVNATLKVAPNVNFVQTRISSLSAGVEPDIKRDYCTYNYKIPGSAETWLKCLK